MRHSTWALALLVTLLAVVSAFTLGRASPPAHASSTIDLCGVLPTSVPIDRDARLVCDVECQQVDNLPCINFVANNIKLSLNGFKMTGPSNTPSLSNCATTENFFPGDGVGATGRTDIVIEGPGVIQRFKRHGIALNGVRKAVVKKLVSHQNCFSGVWLVNATRETLLEEVVSVKNSAASSVFPCGGTCITNSHDNRIRRSEFAGNGSVAAGPQGFPNDFGVGLVGSSSGNIIEENGIGGNINGILLVPIAAASPTGNLIRKNVITGNPPIQVSASAQPDVVGSDIRDASGNATNRFKENLCLTYIGTNPPPCPNVPQFAGHQNN